MAHSTDLSAIIHSQKPSQYRVKEWSRGATLSVVVLIAVVASALVYSEASSASPVSSPMAATPFDPGMATVAALATQIVSMSATATAQAATQATIAALSTQVAGIAQTATTAAAPPPTETLTPKPTATPADTPTATPPPKEGHVLYRSGKTGLKKWIGDSGWSYRDGLLLFDGSEEGSIAHSPYRPTVSDYAIEADIRVIRGVGCDTYFGLIARLSNESGISFRVDFCSGNWNGLILSAEGNLASTGFVPGTDWHTYRLEVRGSEIRDLVDGVVVLEATDLRFPGPGEIGVIASQFQLEVRSIKVIAL